MKPEQQRIKIAQACGWTNCEADSGFVTRYRGTPSETTVRVMLPDYLNDLNAMHEAEKILTCPQFNNYILELSNITTNYSNPQKETVIATATQRAEAFLKTLNLWED